MKKSKKTKSALKKNENLILARNLVVVLAFLALVVGAVALPSSDFFLRRVPAVTVGDVTLSAKDFGRCYENTYKWYKLSLTEKVGDAAMLPEFENLDKTVRDEKTGETYSEFFRKLTVDKITELYALYGAQLTPEMVPFQISQYAEKKKASLEFTNEQLVAYMAENRDMCDSFTYRYITLKTESGDDAEISALRDLAKEITGRVESEEDMIAEARAYNCIKYAEDDSTLVKYSGDLLSPYYRDFLRDSARKYGDTIAVDMPMGAYVVYFVSRENDPETAEARLREESFENWLAEVKPSAKMRWGATFSY